MGRGAGGSGRGASGGGLADTEIEAAFRNLPGDARSYLENYDVSLRKRFFGFRGYDLRYMPLDSSGRISDAADAAWVRRLGPAVRAGFIQIERHQTTRDVSSHISIRLTDMGRRLINSGATRRRRP